MLCRPKNIKLKQKLPQNQIYVSLKYYKYTLRYKVEGMIDRLLLYALTLSSNTKNKWVMEKLYLIR